MSNADLDGAYALAAFSQEQVSGGVRSQVDWGTASFDGAGNFSATNSNREFGPAGQFMGSGGDSGSYSVLADGQIDIGGSGTTGMVSTDGSVAFLSEWSGTESFLTVLVRKGASAPTSGTLNGDWFISLVGAEQPAPFASSSQRGATGVVSIGGFGGPFTFNGDSSWAELSGSGGGPDSSTGTILLAADGSLAITSEGSPYIVDGWMADREDFGIMASVNEPSDMLMGFLIRDRGPLDTLGVSQVSVSAGGSQPLSIWTGKDNAFLAYFVLGSLSGTTPGIPVGGEVMPLNFDSYTSFTLTNPNSPILAGSFAGLDMFGAGIASFNVPPASSPAYVGLTVHHAFVVFDPSDPDGVGMVSNAVQAEIVP